jgi:DNA mismatch endonuclease (patch repair protein)
MDMFTRKRRSQIMSRITSKNTLPEMRVRQALHALGHRFRLHRKDLPGKPDIVLPKLKIVIFVHGCFWHGHTCCDGRRPKTNTDYWDPKLDRNIERDREHSRLLRLLGWGRIVVWECETPNPRRLAARLRATLRRMAARPLAPKTTRSS